MSGVVPVAVADESSSGGDSSQGASAPSAPAAPSVDADSSTGAFGSQQWPGLRWMNGTSADKSPKVGPIAPPAMNLPNRFAQIVSGDEGGPARLTVPREIQILSSDPPSSVGAAGSQSTPRPGAATGTAGQSSTPTVPNDSRGRTGTTSGQASAEASNSQSGQSAAAAQPPAPPDSDAVVVPAQKPYTIDLTKLVPPGVALGPPITIKNPLAELLPLDLYKPLLPQILPPPLVFLLNSISQRFQLASLLIAPALDFTVPPAIADALAPVFASDIVLPTFDITSPAAPGTVASPMTAGRPVRVPAPPNTHVPPAEIAPMGMDLPQSPLEFAEPPEAPAPAPTDVTPQPTSPPGDASATSETVAFRAGYSDYLRNAGLAQITAIAVPGAVAILLFAVGGGFLGYRQARAGHVIRAEGIGRFLR
jgi:hypothetical protein